MAKKIGVIYKYLNTRGVLDKFPRTAYPRAGTLDSNRFFELPKPMDAPKDRKEGGEWKAPAGGDAAKSTAGKSMKMPLKTGTLLKCRWRDGTLHPAEIIERRLTPSGELHGYEYYVHYTKCEYIARQLLRNLGLRLELG